MVVGLEGVGGEFVLPAARPRGILFVSGGSGITPVLSMLRTMRDEGSDRRDHVHPLRPDRDGGLLPRGTRRHARCSGFARVHPFAQGGRPDRLLLRRTSRRLCRTPTRCSSAARPHWSRRSAKRAPTRSSESFVPPVFAVPSRGVRWPGGVRRQRRRRRRRRTLAARAGRGRRTARPKADAAWASATPAPAARPAARSRT